MHEQHYQNHLSEADCADLVLSTQTPAARDQALAHARACPSCEERLRLHAATQARASARHGRVLGSPRVESRVLQLPRRPWVWLAAAAALTAVLTLPRLMPAPAREPQRWLPTPEAGITLREGETDPHFSAGLAAYARRDLKLARRELEAAKLTGGAEIARQLYLGNTLLALDEPASALTLLRRIDLLNVPEPWQEEALWSLQLAYRRTGQEMRADSLLRTLHARPDSMP